VSSSARGGSRPESDRTVPGAAGTLVLIGGALDEDPAILDRIVALARDARTGEGGGAPRIAIFTTASQPAPSAAEAAAADPEHADVENDEADGRYYVDLFARHGAIGVPIPVGSAAEPPFPGAAYHRGTAESDELAELVRSCSGVFFGGGDQTHYVLALFRAADPTQPHLDAVTGLGTGIATGTGRRDTAVMRAVREVLARGGVVAGTSAGLAIQQGAHMVSGGTSRAAWLGDVEPGYADDDALRHLPEGGFGFFTEGMLDSHFNEWGRVPRAVRLATSLVRPLVFGVDEHTALVYRPAERSGEVIGAGGVSILDLGAVELGAVERGGSQASGAAGDGGRPAVLGVRWSHLTAGDGYDFARGLATRADAERVGADAAAPPVNEHGEDVWSENSPALLRLAQRLLASSSRVASGDSPDDVAPRFRITLLRDERTSWTEAGGFTDLVLSIIPTPHNR